MVGFGEAVKRGFAGYATFSGRATRAEYWWWALFTVLARIIPYVLLLASIDTNPDGSGTFSGLWLTVWLIIELALILPTISVAVRRLHDSNRSGWWCWIGVICGPWLFILFLLPSSEGQNQYG